MRHSTQLLVASLAFAAPLASQTAVDLNTWTPESYPAVSGFGAGVWNVAADGSSVTQTVNGQPTMFVSDFPVFNTEVEGQITVSGGDDDYIGFVLGYLPGDTTSAAADYLLVDWKRGTQGFDFGAPSCTPGSTAPAGLAVSRVVGIPTADEFWGHTTFDAPACSDLNNGLTELARGSNLGATGWSANTTYTFKFEFSSSNLRVYVDNVLEMDVSGSFANGRMGFYNFSQAGVTYNAFTLDCPATWSNYGAGWAGTNGVPSLTLSSPPVLGTTIDIQMGNASGTDANSCFVYGFDDTPMMSGFGGMWMVDVIGIVPFHPIPAGGLNEPYAVPDLIELCGVEMFAQLVQADPGASQGVSFSEGLRVVFGL